MKTILLLISSITLISCASVPYYQKVNENGFHRVGYTDTKISSNQWRVTYLDVNSADAYKKFLMRSSDLAKQNNKRYFTVKDVGASKENSMMLGIGYGSQVDIALPQYEATIVMCDKDTPNSFDAEDILSTNPIPPPQPKRQLSSNKSCSGFQCR
jgi:hypothetical protein